MHRWLGAALAGVVTLGAARAEAFCGFYVAPGESKLTNDATMVVLLRDGTRTVLSMQNDYQGPPEDFALVVPVPVVLQKDNVKTLERDIFARVDTLAAPRLVEYWEQDPCPEWERDSDNKEGGTGTRAKGEEGSMGRQRYGVPAVWIEAKFAVGEYEIVILGANDALALDGWLRDNHYRIPQGAEEALRPYVTAGSKFFVAKVDTKKVAFANGRARLSPLRFHYDSETFSLPVRLGLLNSSGHQDLVVHVLARQRYDVANYPRATLPTNLEVDDSVRARYGELYAAVFDATLEKHPKAVVTEYAWSYNNCDPCPMPPLTESELKVLGADVAPSGAQSGEWVLTRLHARYSKADLGADLVFVEAPPIHGGREDGDHSTEARPSQGSNDFQTRFIVRHEWTGPITCSDPMRGMWGGPPSNRPRLPPKTRDPEVTRGAIDLATILRTRVDSIGVVGNAPRLSSYDPDDDTFGAQRRRFGWGALGGLGLAVAIATVTELRARRRR